MALLYECRESCTYIVLDIADIVRDGDFSTTAVSPALIRKGSSGGRSFLYQCEHLLGVKSLITQLLFHLFEFRLT